MSEAYTINDDQFIEVKRNDWAAQLFTPVEDHTLYWVTLKIYGGYGRNYAIVEIQPTDAGIPTTFVLDSSPIWLDKIPQHPAGKPYRVSLHGSANLLAGRTYALIVRPGKMRWGDKLYWRYDQGDATYPRGNRIFSNNEGDSWTSHPNDDHYFIEWGKPPSPPPPPDPPIENFTTLDMNPTLIPGGYSILVTTATPCHLYMFWTNTDPEKHKTPIFRRGLYLKEAIRYCFVNWHKNEQQEEGDTLYHTFIKCGWAHCEERWFTFRAQVDGEWSPSVGPIFYRHRLVPSEGILGQNLITPIPDNYALLNEGRLAQTFTPFCNHNIRSLSIAMFRTQDYTDGDWHVQIRTNNDWHPSDTVLWEEEISVLDFPINGYSWFTFSIGSLPVLGGTPYWIVMWRTGYTYGWSYPYSKGNQTDIYKRGEFLYSYTGTAPWYGHNEEHDLAFIMRGD